MSLQKDALKKGHIYTIKSRNLHVGVYDGENGLLGLRQKFGERYLFTEYLARECGGDPSGTDTAYPQEEIGTYEGDIATDNKELLTLLDELDQEHFSQWLPD